MDSKSSKKVVIIVSRYPFREHSPAMIAIITSLSKDHLVIWIHKPEIGIGKLIKEIKMTKMIIKNNKRERPNLFLISLPHPLPFIRFKKIYEMSNVLLWNIFRLIVLKLIGSQNNNLSISIWFLHPLLYEGLSEWLHKLNFKEIIFDSLDLTIKNEKTMTRNFLVQYKFTGLVSISLKGEKKAHSIMWTSNLTNRIRKIIRYLVKHESV